MGPLAEVKFQQVVFKFLHRTKVVVQQISQWQDKIQPLGYQSSEGTGQITQKNISSYMRRYGQQRRLQTRIQRLRSWKSLLDTVHYIGTHVSQQITQ